MRKNWSEIFRILFKLSSWGVAYYIVNRLSLKYFLTSEGIAIAWPPIGIFISAIILSKPRERPFMVMLLFLADFLADLHTDVPYITKFIYALTSTGDASISAYILLRFAGDPFTLTKARNLLLYVLFSVIICNGVFSFIVSFVTHTVQGSDLLAGFLYSWVADGVGNILVMPLIISWSTLTKKDLKYIRTRHTLEVLLLIVLLVSLNILMFPYSDDGLLFSFIINYLSFPFIIWAIFRFDMKIVTTVLILLTSVMLFNLMRDTDVFTEPSVSRHYMFFQLYIASIAIITLLITAVIDERNQAHKALIESENNYRTVADYTYAWEYWIDSNGNLRYMSPAVKEITGYNAEDFKLNPSLLNEIIYPDDRYIWNHHVQNNRIIKQENQRKIEFRIISKDRIIKWIGHDCRHIYNGDTFIGLRVSNRDITSLVEAERRLLFNTVETEERERNRYSRELHDGLGPLLSTIKMYIQSLSETKDVNRIKKFTDEINNIIKIAIQTMRDIAHGISPYNLNHAGYVNAMIDFTEKINNARKLQVSFDFNNKVRFSSFYEIILYRISTELINNTIKHADASKIEIAYNFDQERRNISLNYRDNGKGFDMTSVPRQAKGMGLANIQHRLKMLRGNFSIQSEVGKGVKILIDFPVNEKDIKPIEVTDAL